jgi:hypothetical protein
MELGIFGMEVNDLIEAAGLLEGNTGFRETIGAVG